MMEVIIKVKNFWEWKFSLIILILDDAWKMSYNLPKFTKLCYEMSIKSEQEVTKLSKEDFVYTQYNTI